MAIESGLVGSRVAEGPNLGVNLTAPWGAVAVIGALWTWSLDEVRLDPEFLTSTLTQRDPEVFFGPSAFLEARGTKVKEPHMLQEQVVFLAVFVWSCRLRRRGQTTIIFLEMCGFLALILQASPKTTWPKNNLGIPSEQ